MNVNMKPWGGLKIALDFDETYTAHPEMWKKIVEVMKSEQSDVKFVTYRYEKSGNNEDIQAAAEELGIEIIYCNYFQKAQVTALSGWIPDIWVDDMPILIPMQSQLEGMLMGIKRSDRQEEVKAMVTEARNRAKVTL